RSILDGGDLRGGDQAFDAVDLDIGRAVSRDLDRREQVRHAAHLVALKEPLAVDAVGCPDDRARTALEMIDHPRPDLFEVLRELELGKWRRLRPQWLARLGNHHTHHDVAAAL